MRVTRIRVADCWCSIGELGLSRGERCKNQRDEKCEKGGKVWAEESRVRCRHRRQSSNELCKLRVGQPYETLETCKRFDGNAKLTLDALRALDALIQGSEPWSGGQRSLNKQLMP